MKWFEGDIPSAIQQTKVNKSIFIVFISSDDDKSREMESFLHREDVTGVVETNRCVAIKLLGNSNECKFFSQIYPVVVIPSTFFIADTGLPLEVIGECKSHEDFLAKVRNAVEKNVSAAVRDAVQTSAVLPEQQQSTSSAAIASSVPVVTSTVESAQAQDTGEKLNNDGATAAAAGNGDENTTATTPDLEERVEKAKQLLEQKREQKSKQEAEDEKRRELERRNVGHNVQKLRQQQKEMDLLEAKMELKKEREEDKLARQRVKQEIERDRAEKAARFNKGKDDKAKEAEEAKRQKLLEQQAALAEEQAKRSETARIQFRMPDGSSVTQQFAATDTFASVQQFITQHVGAAVTLSMTFPRRTFTPEDNSRTLQELQLVPAVAIMVIPPGVSTSVVRSSSGIFSISGITGLLLAPVWFVWNLLGSLLGFTRVTASASAPTKSTRSTSAPVSSAKGGERSPGSAYKRPTPSSKQDGAITRFRNNEDDESDEDRATWNGNSTQQM